jgi:hypothetical protein
MVYLKYNQLVLNILKVILLIIQNYEEILKVRIFIFIYFSNYYLVDVMIRLSLSSDTNIRSQLMAQIRAITSSNLLDISDKMKQILCERARDKIVCQSMFFFEFTHVFLVGSSERIVRLSWTCL